MAYKINDRVALKETGVAEAGSCGHIIKDYGNGHYDVKITQDPPPGCAPRAAVTAIYISGSNLTKCGCD